MNMTRAQQVYELCEAFHEEGKSPLLLAISLSRDCEHMYMPKTEKLLHSLHAQMQFHDNSTLKVFWDGSVECMFFDDVLGETVRLSFH